MQAAQGYQDLLHATRAQLEANGQLDKWRQQQQQQASQTSKISRIEVCGGCHGHRTKKVVYNQHMVLERTCSQCNGEGVTTKEELAQTSVASAAPGGSARTRTQGRNAASAQVPSVQSA